MFKIIIFINFIQIPNNYTQMDNQSNNSQAESDIYSITYQKPKNKNKFVQKGLTISSNFPSGNLQSISIKQQFIMQGKYSLVVQFYSSSDTNSDIRDKAWFYFVIEGMRDLRNIKYSQILFKFKNANIYRKFTKEKKYRPYIVVKELPDKQTSEWKPIYLSLIYTQQNQVIQAQFIYMVHPGIDKAAFASNIPYNIRNLQELNTNMIKYLENVRKSTIYYHREIIAETVDQYPVYLLTITAANNVASYSNRQPDLWPYKGNRPYTLKNKPQILITARVHPSQISSSFCIEGIIQQLVKNPNFQLLTQMFIFRIVPMMNPYGVQNGYYRLDNYFQNLNRFYGYSDPIKTPSVYAVQQLIKSLRQKSKLFLFMDIHGHNSPKPSFIFGNYSNNFFHYLQNRTFVKLIQVFNLNLFNSLECQFSKRNMLVKQKYDQHSKQASARVFAYRGTSSTENNINNIKSQLFVEHSYTLEVHPYISSITPHAPNSSSSICYNSNQNQTSPNKKKDNIDKQRIQLPYLTSISPVSQNQIAEGSIIKQFKTIGTNVLLSILQILGVNNYIKLALNQDCRAIRKRCFKQLVRIPQFYDRSRKQRQKQINKQVFYRYYQKWNIIPTYRQYLSKLMQKQLQKQIIQLKLKQCPIHQFYQQSKNKPYKDYRKKTQKIQTNQVNRKQIQIKQQLNNISIQQNMLDHQDNLQYQQINKNKNYPITTVTNINCKLSAGMKIVQDLDEKYKEITIGYPISIRNYNSNNSFKEDEENKGNFLIKRHVSQLEKKVKRLIFKHRTQLQSKDYKQTNKNNKFQFQISSLLEKNKSRENIKNQVSIFEPIQLSNRLQSLSHSKSKQKKLKKDSNQFKIIEFLSKINKSPRQAVIDTEIKTKLIKTQNPKIKQLLKKVQLDRKQKNKNQSITDNEQTKKSQFIKMKPSNSVLANLVILNSKKPKTQISNEKTNIRMIHSLSNNCVVYNGVTNNLSPFILPQTKSYQKSINISQQQINKSTRRLPGIYWTNSPKSKLDSDMKNKYNFKQQEKDSTLQKLKVNNLNFIEIAKQKLLANKKTL